MGINTGIGIGIGIPFIGRTFGDKQYISPDVLASLRGVWIADQNTNNSTYRNIIKNKLSNRGGDFEILNAAYRLNSGYGLYNYDYTTFNILADLCRVIDRTKVEYFAARGAVGFYKPGITSYKGRIKITGVTEGVARKEILRFQIYTDATDNNEAVQIYEDGEYYIDIKGLGINITRVYFYAVRNGSASHTLTTPIYIEQVPRFDGAFVTDGVNDVIRSKSSVTELLGNSKEVTVVSMMCQNTLYNDSSSANNSLPIDGINTLPVYNNVSNINKTGIYGYTYRPSTASVLNNIMGDKNDYTAVRGGSNSDVDRFEVTRNKFPAAVAWYWTFIADKVLTSFEIEQVIAYYNLDKYVNPSIYYDVKKQGITNDNHTNFNDKLIDYSGNKRDLQLYNVGWGENSGISNDGTKLVLDGVNDYGLYTGDLGLKDYTFIMNRSIFRDQIITSGRLAKSGTESYTNTPFLFESYNTDGKLSNVYSYGSAFGLNKLNEDGWTYLSTYNYNGTVIPKGTGTGTGNGLIIGAEYSSSNFLSSAVSHVLLYPYSLNEFLIERQLKKLKAGTLYEDKVQLNPIINIIGDSSLIESIYYFDNSWSKSISSGEYMDKGNALYISVKFDDLGSYVKEVVCGNKEVSFYKSSSTHPNTYDIIIKNIDKTPQRIDITVVEAKLFEQIIQDFPILVSLKNREGKVYTYGDSIDIGEEVTYATSTNLLPDLYRVELNVLLNNKSIVGVYQKIEYFNSITAVKSKTYLVDDNEPICILSPERLKLSNAVYKRLGYIPDLSGNGNHGKLYNLAYNSTSGATDDNAIQLDGINDSIEFPTLWKGGKQVLVKVNYQSVGILYDQRAVLDIYNFAIYTPKNDYLSYRDRNPNGLTYIDGVLNKHIKNGELTNITHNIVGVAPYDLGETASPVIGKSITNGSFLKLKLYTFMLFDNFSTNENIKKLNDIIGIEGKYVEAPEYYYDVAGADNSDAERRTIKDRVSGVCNFTGYNFAFNKNYDSGYGGINNSINFIPPPTNNSGWMTETDRRCFYTVLDDGLSVNITKSINPTASWFWTQYGSPKGRRCWYEVIGVNADHGIVFGSDLADVSHRVVVTSDGIYEINWGDLLHEDGSIADPCILSNGWVGNCNIIIKQRAHYPNGLVFDGVDDFLDNKNLPAFDDYTVIAKRELLEIINQECLGHKGYLPTQDGVNNAFIFEYISSDLNTYQYTYGSSKRVEQPRNIVAATSNSYEDVTINKGSSTDAKGMIVGKWYNTGWKGVFYKMIMYSRIIDKLSIHSLKNLFEKDEIIDLNNPIFKDGRVITDNKQ